MEEQVINLFQPIKKCETACYPHLSHPHHTQLRLVGYEDYIKPDSTEMGGQAAKFASADNTCRLLKSNFTIPKEIIKTNRI